MHRDSGVVRHQCVVNGSARWDGSQISKAGLYLVHRLVVHGLGHHRCWITLFGCCLVRSGSVCSISLSNFSRKRVMMMVMGVCLSGSRCYSYALWPNQLVFCYVNFRQKSGVVCPSSFCHLEFYGRFAGFLLFQSSHHQHGWVWVLFGPTSQFHLLDP